MSLLEVLGETPLIAAVPAVLAGRLKPWTTAWMALRWACEIACLAAQPSMLMSPKGASSGRDRMLLSSRGSSLLLKKASMDSRSLGRN